VIARNACLALTAAALAAIAPACGAQARHSNQAPRAAPATAVVWAVGDGADGGQVAKRLARRIARDRPDRLLYLGDVYPAGSPADFRDHYATVYGRLAPITAPTPGNHDWPAHRDGYDRYWRARLHRPMPAWYALRVGGWRVLSLNSEAPHDARSPQLRWLRRTLARGQGNCAIAFWHRPLRSAGLHGDQPDVAPLWAALRGHVRIVVNGHDHDSQRLRARGGIVEYVAGAGGHGLYPINRGYAGLRFGDDGDYAGLRLALRATSARIAFVSVAGRVLDRSRVACSRR